MDKCAQGWRAVPGAGVPVADLEGAGGVDNAAMTGCNLGAICCTAGAFSAHLHGCPPSGVSGASAMHKPSHGRGHMFDPCITHQYFPCENKHLGGPPGPLLFAGCNSWCKSPLKPGTQRIHLEVGVAGLRNRHGGVA